jgi:cytidyltransferase-like protein
MNENTSDDQQIVVYAAGVFDLFHFGHMEFLTKIRDLFPGCVLIAGVHNDEDVESYKRTPIMTMQERARAVWASQLADEILLNAPLLETEAFYRDHGISKTVHAHSVSEDAEYRRTSFPDAGDRLFRVDYNPGISTTQLIERISSRR